MDDIINIIKDNFSIIFIIKVNIITYLFIKLHDEINGTKKVPTIMKRIWLVIALIINIIIEYYIVHTSIDIIINSAIATPVAWSWILKPICKKIGIDYKHIKDTIE